MKTALERILSEIGIENIIEILSSENLTWKDLHTLLLYSFEKRIKNITPADVMKNYAENRFSTIADVNPKDITEIDKMLYSLLPQSFSAIELSPVNPIGVNTVLTALDPKITLATIRNMEVVGDPGMALAIECAHRRRLARTKKDATETHLATSHRSLRMQNFPKKSGFTSHFKAFALASGARDLIGYNSFELRSLSSHLQIWLDFISRSSEIGYKINNVSIIISDIRIIEKLILDGRINKEEALCRTKDPTFHPFQLYSINLPSQINCAKDIPITHPELETYIRELQFTEQKIIEPLKSKYPFAHFSFDLERCSGKGYYSGLCYRITAENSSNNKYSLAGGGVCDWTKKLLQSKKEHLITSGFGTELFCKFK